MRPFLAFLLALAIALPSLAPAADWSGRESTLDGVKVVENPAEPMRGQRVVEAREVWRLGGYSDAYEEFFGVIGDVLVDEERNFYILDTQLSEVKVYAENGAFLRTVGREGEGPGEFRRPTSMLFLPDGSLGVIQAFPSKMVLLSRDGTPIGDFPFEPQGEGFPGLGSGEAAGDQISLTYSTMSAGEGSFVRQSYLAFVDLSGEVRTVLHRDDSQMDYASSLLVEKDWNTFSECWAGGRDGSVYARLDFTDYAIHVWKPDGTLRQVIRREHARHVRSDDEIETIESNWERSIARWVREPRFEIEPDWNPVEDLFARDDGELWVRTTRGTRDLPEGTIAHFDVYDPAGRYLEELVIRGEFDPEDDGLFLDGDYLLVVTDLRSARDAMRGGGSEDDTDLDAKPMEVICYQIPARGVAEGP